MTRKSRGWLVALIVFAPMAVPAQGSPMSRPMARLSPTGSGMLLRHLDDEDPRTAAGTRYRIEVTGAVPSDAMLTISWHGDNLPGGVTSGDLEIVHRTGLSWVTDSNSRIMGDTAFIEHVTTGEYQIRWRSPRAPCTDSGYRRFDYRLGKWDYRATGYDPGRDEMLEDRGRCALFDHYVDVNGGRSDAFLIYRPDERAWYVTTIDPGGRSVMKGTADRDGAAFYHSPTDREVYRPRPEGGIEFRAERSTDGGAHWTAWVTAAYTRVREE